MKIIPKIISDNPLTISNQLVYSVGGKRKKKKTSNNSLGRHYSEHKSITIYQEPVDYKWEQELPYEPTILEDIGGSYEMEFIDADEVDFENDDEEEQIELIQLMYKNIKKLTKIQQQVLELLLEGKSLIQISEQTGLAITTVRTSLWGSQWPDKNHKKPYGGSVRALRKLMTPKWRIIDCAKGTEELIVSMKDWCSDKGINYKSFNGNGIKTGYSHGYKLEKIDE